jgi:hypothetical protein
MTRKIACSVFSLLLAALLGLKSTAVAADKRDFSGLYMLKEKTKQPKPEKGEAWTLRVTQTATAVEVTRVMDSHQNVNKFPLDGSEGPYVSPGGPTGTCKAQLKSKYLILDTFVTSHPQPNGPAVQMHTRERWELSSDSKTLKIRTDVDFPQFSGILNGFQVVEPWSEIYTRN